MEDGLPKKWIPEKRKLDQAGVESITWDVLHEGNFHNLFWADFQALRKSDEARKHRWWAIMAMLLNNRKSLVRLMSHYFFTREMAKNSLAKLDYLRGFRFNLMRINPYLAALESKVPFDYTDLVVEESKGEEVIPSGTGKITKNSTVRGKPRAIDFGPIQPASW